jgi:hypothetical protein
MHFHHVKTHITVVDAMLEVSGTRVRFDVRLVCGALPMAAVESVLMAHRFALALWTECACKRANFGL